ncbi:UDP-glucose 4-epimerase GalE [Bradyrhizobium sp. JYMT SZCCT0428]|uniref:UDP-glucose 4-epimerase GalE n=1 Tax=Bradyrhizobium sp. JYMT SZCCT0428 TaxID=2807673 RepID=UPI001BA69224|nr:UDP-glucose 4-epimerase GalE [Bradyrhizobium sp. JYMT SZCCT0428]MBR1151562.1 UDP-glucose 4-epimerase GalE [Bradyrhizobium sp. JYMT SZCCT0428]
MPVLVTGGAGYIGSQAVLELTDTGETVIVLDNLSTGFEAAVSRNARLIVGDIGDSALVGRIISEHGIDAIMHFSGSIVVPESVANPLEYYHNNTCKTRSLVESAVRGQVPYFIFSSTAAVYGTGGTEPVKESSPLRPQSPYGRSKLMSEWMLNDIANAHGLKYTVLRYFNVAGADPRGRAGQATKGATHLIKIASEAALGKRKFVEVFGTDYPTADGTCIRDYIHVQDLAVAHRLALARLRSGGDNLTANCGYSRGYSVLEMLNAVERVNGEKLDIRFSNRRPGDPAAIVADSALARSELGWNPEFDNLDAIIGSALRWERDRSY